MGTVIALGKIPSSPIGEGSLCLFRRWLFPCPGCGSLRALAAVSRGELREAWSLHPLIPLVLAEVLGLWLASGVRCTRRPEGRRSGEEDPERPSGGPRGRGHRISGPSPRGRPAVRRTGEAGASRPSRSEGTRLPTQTVSAGGVGIREPLRERVSLDLLLFAHGAAFLALWLGRAATGSLPW